MHDSTFVVMGQQQAEPQAIPTGGGNAQEQGQYTHTCTHQQNNYKRICKQCAGEHINHLRDKVVEAAIATWNSSSPYMEMLGKASERGQTISLNYYWS